MDESLALMQLHIETLFTLNAEGRITGINEPHHPRGPRFFFGRTVQGNVWRFHRDLPAALVEELESIARLEPLAVVLDGPAEATARLSLALESYGPVLESYDGPAFRFPGRMTAPIGVVYVTQEDRLLLPDDSEDLVEFMEHRQPCAAVLLGEKAVSLCYSARSTPRSAEAGVETSPESRRRGFGTAVVAGWAAAVQAQGRVPLYSTSWDNTASRALAHRLGLVIYGATIHFN